MMNNQFAWRLTCTLTIIVAMLTFTPLITPKRIYQPEFWGMPYTLWAGIFQAIILIVLTYVGTIIRSRIDSGDHPE